MPATSSQRVIATYSAPPSFLTAPDWANIRTAVRSHLPLKNLHWKPLSRPSIRSIQTVDVEFRALEVGGPGEAGSSSGGGTGGGRESMTPASFLEKPFLNCYFVTCEVGSSLFCLPAKLLQLQRCEAPARARFGLLHRSRAHTSSLPSPLVFSPLSCRMPTPIN